MSNNFRKTAFLKKNINCDNATKQRIVLKKFGSVSVLKFLHRLAFDFPCNFSRDLILTDVSIENFKKWFQVFQRMKRPQFFSGESLGVKLQFNIDFFFRIAVLRKFLTRLPTRQDGVENRDKVYYIPASRDQPIYMTLDSIWSKCIVQRF